MKRSPFLSLFMLTPLAVGCGQPVSNTPPAADSLVSQAPSSSESQWTDPASVAYAPLPQHGTIELSNLRFENGAGGGESISVDWKVTAGEPYGTFLVIKQTGSPQTLEMGVTIWPNEQSGTINGSVQSYGGGSSGTPLATGCEVYMVTLEGDQRHKISNTLTSGNASTTEVRPASAAPSPVVSAPAHLEKLPADVSVPPGTKLYIFTENKYQPVTVLESMSDGGLRIQWDGRDFTGVFPRASLDVATDVLASLPRDVAVSQPAASGPHNAADRPAASSAHGQPMPGNAGGNSSTLDASTTLEPGQKLEAQWARRWLPVTVKAQRPDGRVEIHWDGYSDSFDEAVGRERLRFPQGK